MANAPLSREAAQQALDAYTVHGDKVAAARSLGMNIFTFRHRIKCAEEYKLTPSKGVVSPADPRFMAAEIKRLNAELVAAEKHRLTDERIKRQIIGLASDVENFSAPPWLVRETKADSAPGVPTLFLSDLHWGESVDPNQIGGVNRYSLKIAHERLGRCAERAVRLLSILDPALNYPGLVLALGGDMVSGNIHPELVATNEENAIGAVVDLFGALAGLIAGMADKFGHVFIPCVTGNHGRDTVKIWSKDRHKTSFDWLLYTFLAKHFAGDKRVTFYIPDGPDAYYRVGHYRYLLTHGDQFRGGDGLIGALGPIVRGDHKKRSRNMQIDMAYDTLLLGHFHQYMHLTRLIVNGSLKGMDEYAYSNNFPFEPPQQALWLTHPQYGITFRAPIFADHRKAPAKTAWASVPS